MALSAEGRKPLSGPVDRWWRQVGFFKGRRGKGYRVKVGRKLGDLSFCYYDSRPVPTRAHAEALGRAVERAFREGRPAVLPVCVTSRVVERRVRGSAGNKRIWVGTVRHWIGDSSYVWREITPQDSREEAERIAAQTAQAAAVVLGGRR